MKVTHHEQMGFMPGIQGRLNIRNYINRSKKKIHMIFCRDAKKKKNLASFPN